MSVWRIQMMSESCLFDGFTYAQISNLHVQTLFGRCWKIVTAVWKAMSWNSSIKDSMLSVLIACKFSSSEEPASLLSCLPAASLLWLVLSFPAKIGALKAIALSRLFKAPANRQGFIAFSCTSKLLTILILPAQFSQWTSISERRHHLLIVQTY